MSRSLDNLFNEPQRSPKSEPSGPEGGDFDALLDGQQIETKGAIDPSWDKVRTQGKDLSKKSAPYLSARSTKHPSVEDDSIDDLMGMGGTSKAPNQPAASPRAGAESWRKNAAFPPEPKSSKSPGNHDDARASFPWWVVVGAIMLILAGAAAVVTIT